MDRPSLYAYKISLPIMSYESNYFMEYKLLKKLKIFKDKVLEIQYKKMTFIYKIHGNFPLLNCEI